MAKIKLTTVERVHIPDVEFDTDEGILNNRDMETVDQVKAEITLATMGQKSRYIDSYSVSGKKKGGDVRTKTNMNYSLCVSKHCTKITGLEDFKIIDGKSLCEHEPTPELNDIILDLFLKINGVHKDDEKAGSDGGEFTEGEE